MSNLLLLYCLFLFNVSIILGLGSTQILVFPLLIILSTYMHDAPIFPPNCNTLSSFLRYFPSVFCSEIVLIYTYI